MVRIGHRSAEAKLACKHACVSVLGFLVDFAVLRGGLHLALQPAVARVLSLALAMHVTFVLNGIFVFSSLRWDRTLPHRWAGYIATNAFGNLCNYWIFITLVSLHGAVVSRPLFALAAASLAAWAINYGCTRFLVFGASVGLVPRRLRSVSWTRVPAPAEPGSARR